jgi:anti-anti-sigma factor
MVRPTKFDIEQRTDGSTLVLAITGELDMNTADLLAQAVDQRLEQRPSALTLDLGELAFMDSSGLRLLIELYDRSRQESWQLTLVTPRDENATMVLRATGADAALPFQSDGDSR